LTDSENSDLVAAAARARDHAYAPYSHFAVGAAVRAADGAIYSGCNVENASFGLTVCAERNAVANAVARGATRIIAVAVVTENGALPCGACRQVLSEFNPDMLVLVVDAAGKRRSYRLGDILPEAFGPRQLPGSGEGQP
jgi:cytidine deaminase